MAFFSIANSWRIGPDDTNWHGVLANIEINANLALYAGPGGWNGGLTCTFVLSMSSSSCYQQSTFHLYESVFFISRVIVKCLCLYVVYLPFAAAYHEGRLEFLIFSRVQSSAMNSKKQCVGFLLLLPDMNVKFVCKSASFSAWSTGFPFCLWL